MVKIFPQIPVYKIPDLSFSLADLDSATQWAQKRFDFSQDKQISLTSPCEMGQDVHVGTGSLFDFTRNQWIKSESEFKYFIALFKPTYFYEIYRKVSERLPFHLGRMRLMQLAPRTCYSMHQDPQLRFHIALQTNPHCYMAFNKEGLFHIPKDGHVYATDTRREHTAMNCSTEPRLHLVMCAATRKRPLYEHNGQQL